MEITANNPALRTWVSGADQTEFPIQNLPFGIFYNASITKRVGVRIGDFVLDLFQLASFGYFEDLEFGPQDFDQPFFNPMMQHGKMAMRALRNRLSDLLSDSNE